MKSALPSEKLWAPLLVVSLIVLFPVVTHFVNAKSSQPSKKVLATTNKAIATPTPTPSTASVTVVSSDTILVTPTTAPTHAARIPAQNAVTVIPPSPTSLPATAHTSWNIQSVDAMKDTKDAICGPRSSDWINKWLDKAVELGANYVAISTPYDDPSCGSSLNYTKAWVSAIRAHGLHVWHRHMPLAFEGIYNVQKNNSSTFLDLVKNYITSNPDLFQSGDIVTPIPEPQNGGIQGVTNCANSICQFSSAANFNEWLRNAMATTNDALSSIGKSGQLKVGYFGFDGFVTWGDNNPDWHGILEDSTVAQMGNITIDHYPELVHETMSQSLSALTAKYPHTPIVIGEWGTVTGGNTIQQIQDDMGAVKNDGNIIGFNYWQFGPSGSGEQLIDDSFSNLAGFSAVQSFYK